MSRDSQPTREELLAMAYADGELHGEARAEFEALMARRPELAREAAAAQRLLVLSRAAAGPEPMDHEWRRLDADPLQRASLWGGFALLALSAAAFVGWIGWSLAGAQPAWPLQLALGSAALGALLLFLGALRARLRTLPYDPYRDIER
jgi:anti-sigma factor RsiW